MNSQLEYIVAQLERRRAMRQLAAVARGSGVSLRTVHNALEGKGITTATVARLHTYLKANVRRKEL